MTNLQKYRLYLKNLKHHESLLQELKGPKLKENFLEWNLKYKLKLNKYFSKHLSKEFDISLSYKCDKLFLSYNSNIILGVSFLHKAKQLNEKIVYNKIQIETPKLQVIDSNSYKQFLVIGKFVEIISKNESEIIELFNNLLQKHQKDFTKKIEKPIYKQDKLVWKYYYLLEGLVVKKLSLCLKNGEINFEQLYNKIAINLKFDPFNIELYQVKSIKYLKKDSKFLILGRNAKDDYDTTLPYQVYEYKILKEHLKDNYKQFLFAIFDHTFRYYDHEILFLNE